MNSYNFIIELERQGSQGQKRLRWQWPPRSESTRGIGATITSIDGSTVAEELMCFLGGTLGIDSEFTAEMHIPQRRAWVPLTSETSSKSVPKNCLVRVSVAATSQSANGRDFSTTPTTRTGSTRRGAIAAPIPASAIVVAEEASEPQMLALPWRRFDRDLGNGGLMVAGKKLVVKDVSNSDQGTGLFTWDGSVLLAKYLEHRAESLISDLHGGQRPFGHGAWSLPPDHPASVMYSDEAVVDADKESASCCGGFGSDGNRGPSGKCAIRVLELGCGTGLAGLAAAMVFGGRLGDVEHTATNQSPVVTSVPDDGVKESQMGAEVVLSDLGYALANARENISRNAHSLKEIGSQVSVTELDWCRPLSNMITEGEPFDLILAADAVWLDELVGPLVQTLEGLTVAWARGRGENGGGHRATLPDVKTAPSETARISTASSPGPPAITPVSRRDAVSSSCARAFDYTSSSSRSGRAREGPGTCTDDHANGKRPGPGGEGRSPVVCEPSEFKFVGARGGNNRRNDSEDVLGESAGARHAGRRVLMAYQWRSQRTGEALFRELDKSFHVRQIPAKECHPDYLPSESLCLIEAVRRR